MNLGLKGRVALVAGASSGLGKAVALALAQEGAQVSICSRSRGRARAAAKEISVKTGVEVAAHAADVRNEKACRDWVAHAAKKWGRVDILINNAGGPPEGSFEDVNESDWNRGFELNFLSAVRLSRLVIPYMKKQRWGRIIFIASTSAKQPIEGLAISNALRTGVLGLSKTLSQELGPHNILVNAVCPGYTKTERLEDLARHRAAKTKAPVEKIYQQWTQSIPLKRLAEPEEIAQAVVYLASDRASYITGVALQVDGGRVTSPF
ncbi:MAG: SDR family oxidoreductase [Dehalococcoidia bacterium]|nr:SDR family oxidoreductase [Dehalococcoidia bacterium]